MRVGLASLVAALLACGGGGRYHADGPEPEPEARLTDGRTGAEQASAAPAPIAAPTAPAPGPASIPTTAPAPASAPSPVDAPARAPATAPEGDAPEISKSRGTKGGAVVLWPRIVMPRGVAVDETARAAARELQHHLAELVRHAASGANVDVRPEPERVCPRGGGCEAASFGVLVARAGETGCSAVVLASAAGESEQTLVAWAGSVTLTSASIAFREPPERAVRLQDMASCSGILKTAAKNDDAVVAAIRAKLGR